MFFADTGTACIWMVRNIKGGANRRLFGSFSWASMANALPNAFGAQLAYPGRQTIALCGDGGFTMLALGDLPTLVDRKSRVVHVIFNNESLDFVNIEQQEAGFVPFGVHFKNRNFARMAEAMGAKGIRLEEPGDVKAALTEALAYGTCRSAPQWATHSVLLTRCRPLRRGDQDYGTQRPLGLSSDSRCTGYGADEVSARVLVD
jgi:pyruvate dehydrogenase (quinone)